MIFYTILATIGAILGLFLPETKDRKVPDTIQEEVESLVFNTSKNFSSSGK